MTIKYDKILDDLRLDDSGIASVDGDTGPDVILPTFTGATASTDGSKGLVPAPLSGEQDHFLAGDASWQPVSGISTYTGNFGEMHDDSGTTITLQNTGGLAPSALVDYTPFWSGVSGEVSNITFTAGVSATTPSTLTIAEDGVYLLNASISIQSDTQNAEVFMQPTLNGAAISRLLHSRHYQTTSHTGNVTIVGLLRLAAADEVGLYFASDNNGAVTITIDNTSLLLTYQGQ
jgi:hypothetical protein